MIPSRTLATVPQLSHSMIHVKPGASSSNAQQHLSNRRVVAPTLPIVD